VTDIQDLKTPAAGNTLAAPDGAPEQHARTDTNNIQREMMAKVRRDWEGSATGGGTWRNVTSDSDFTVARATDTTVTIVSTASTDVSSFFPANRKVKISGTGNPVFCFVVSSAFVTDTTTVTVEDFDDASPDNVVPASANKIEFFNAFGGTSEHGIGRGAFEDSFARFFVPQSFDDAGINAAITDAVAAKGIVLLEARTYAISNSIDIVDDTRIWGPGRTALLQAATGLDDDVIKFAANVDKVELRSFGIDGNNGNQASGHGIFIDNGCGDILLQDMYIHDTKGEGISITPGTTGVFDIRINHATVFDTEGGCLRLLDPDGFNTDIFITNSAFLGPGNGSASAQHCLQIHGACHIDNVECDPTAAGAGEANNAIRLEQVDSGGAPVLGAHRVVLNNFVIRSQAGGAGADVVGLFIGGTDCAISNGIVELSGANALPLLIDGRSSGVESAVRNKISNVQFIDGLRCDILSDALGTELIGCTFRDQSAEGLRDNGTDTLIKDCLLTGQADGIALGATTVDSEVSGCTFRDQTDDGIITTSGCTSPIIKNNVFRDVAGDGVNIVAGVTGAQVRNNIFDNTTGTDIIDAGTSSVIDGNTPVVDSSLFTSTGSDLSMTGTTQNIPGMTGLAFPGLGANGVRKFDIDAIISFAWEITTGDIGSLRFRLHMGTNGDRLDTAIILHDHGILNIASGDTDLEATMTFVQQVTPATGDKFGFSAQETNANINGVVYTGLAALKVSSGRVAKVRD